MSCRHRKARGTRPGDESRDFRGAAPELESSISSRAGLESRDLRSRTPRSSDAAVRFKKARRASRETAPGVRSVAPSPAASASATSSRSTTSSASSRASAAPRRARTVARVSASQAPSRPKEPARARALGARGVAAGLSTPTNCARTSSTDDARSARRSAASARATGSASAPATSSDDAKASPSRFACSLDSTMSSGRPAPVSTPQMMVRSVSSRSGRFSKTRTVGGSAPRRSLRFPV